MVNTTRFPSLTGMVQYGHDHGLKVGFYMNNCLCKEKGLPTHYPEDTALLLRAGFDSL